MATEKSFKVDVKEVFSGTIARAKDIEYEMNRLYEIEEKLKTRLKEQKERVTLLDKANSYSSISYEVKQIIGDLIKDGKKIANDTAYLLGISEQYKKEE